MKPLLDTISASPLAGAAPKTMANWRVQGRGPKFIMVGSKPMYDPDDIQAWRDARRVSSTSQSVAA